MSGPLVTPKAKVTPARISPVVWSLTRAPRNPKSTAMLSCTCQIAIGPCRAAAPAGKSSRCSEHSGYTEPRHGIGRNTQTAAASPDLAGAATKSRSSSETNSEVRAPDTVGICASRR